MSGTVNVHELADKNMRFIQKLIDFFRNGVNRRKEKHQQVRKEAGADDFLPSRPIGVKRTLSRKGIYEERLNHLAPPLENDNDQNPAQTKN
jgi:hypothetical protein